MGDRSGNAVGVDRGVGVNVEGVGEANEDVEKCGDIGRLCDLLVAPVRRSKLLDLAVGHPVGMTGHGPDVLQQQSFGFGDWKLVKVSVPKRLAKLSVFVALQLQEPCVA